MMEKITLYKILPNRLFGGDYEFQFRNAEKAAIPEGFTRSSPHPIPEGHFAIMNNGWEYIEGEIPSESEIGPDFSAEVRKKRDQLLAETDWLVIKNLETNQNIPGVWEVYRQALRDIPSQEGFPQQVIWPVKP